MATGKIHKKWPNTAISSVELILSGFPLSHRMSQHFSKVPVISSV